MQPQIPQETMIKSQYAECNERIINRLHFNCVDCAFV